MKRILIACLIFLSAIAPFLSLCRCDAPNEFVLCDDDQTEFWANVGGWGISDDFNEKTTGDNSYKMILDSTHFGELVQHTGQYNFSEYNYFAFMLWRNGTSRLHTFNIVFQTVASNFFYLELNDSSSGWDWVVLPLSYFTSYGSLCDWGNITQLQWVFYGANGQELTYRFDRWAFYVNYPESPAKSTNELELFFIALFFGSFAWIGIILFIILGLVAIKLNKYAGVFVFIIAMLYEIGLYDRLNVYGNNIYYMIILIVFAVFSAWEVFDASK